jgi:hypothetical protein
LKIDNQFIFYEQQPVNPRKYSDPSQWISKLQRVPQHDSG